MKPDLQKIKKLIAHKGMTQTELSQKLGKFPMYITQHLSGTHKIPESVLEKIAKLLEVDVYDLYMPSIPPELEKLVGETLIECPYCGHMIGVSLKCAKIKDPDDPFAPQKSCDA